MYESEKQNRRVARGQVAVRFELRELHELAHRREVFDVVLVLFIDIVDAHAPRPHDAVGRAREQQRAAHGEGSDGGVLERGQEWRARR